MRGFPSALVVDTWGAYFRSVTASCIMLLWRGTLDKMLQLFAEKELI